jgi:6-pyruvoyltetrahydropterin/6-carboxytetrahydropterin synthase
MRIWKEFSAECAHRLPNLPASHKCSRLHGHSYRFRLEFDGPLNDTLGWVVDFGGAVRAAGEMIAGELDHRYLNDIAGLENPTAERIAVWIHDRVSTVGLPAGVVLSAVEVNETCSTGVRLAP